MTREELRDYVDEQRSLNNIPYHVYSALIDGIDTLEQEPTTKNDLVTLTFSKGTLKYSCKDYVVYKKDWLRSHYGAEINIMFGDSQYKELTTKNDLGVDCVSREKVWYMITNGKYSDEDYEQFIDRLVNELADLPSITPIRPKGHWKYFQNKKGDWMNICSNCNSDCGVGYPYNYCPNCGADMRKVEE